MTHFSPHKYIQFFSIYMLWTYHSWGGEVAYSTPIPQPAYMKVCVSSWSFSDFKKVQSYSDYNILRYIIFIVASTKYIYTHRYIAKFASIFNPILLIINFGLNFYNYLIPNGFKWNPSWIVAHEIKTWYHIEPDSSTVGKNTR